MIRILIADDHAIIRNGLKQLILEEYPSAIFGEVGDAESLVTEATNKKWDLVISDLNMPGRSGLEALPQIKQAVPDLPVLIMSMYSEDQYALRVFKAGAAGYLNKETIHKDIIKAIQTVLLSRKFITTSVAQKLAGTLGIESQKQPHEILSNREFEVFMLLVAGKSPAAIAERLSLKSTTISTFRIRLLEKMCMNSNADLIKYAIEKKLV